VRPLVITNRRACDVGDGLAALLDRSENRTERAHGRAAEIFSVRASALRSMTWKSADASGSLAMTRAMRGGRVASGAGSSTLSCALRQRCRCGPGQHRFGVIPQHVGDQARLRRHLLLDGLQKYFQGVRVENDGRALARENGKFPHRRVEGRARRGPFVGERGDSRRRLGATTLINNLYDLALKIADGRLDIAERVAQRRGAVLLAAHRGLGGRQRRIVSGVTRQLARLLAMRGSAGLGGLPALDQVIAAGELIRSRRGRAEGEGSDKCFQPSNISIG
jgi:hypothetical protein